MIQFSEGSTIDERIRLRLGYCYMKFEAPKDADAPLRRALQEWKLTDPLPSGFASRVWQRVDRERREKRVGGWAVVLDWLGYSLCRPGLAAAYLAVLVAAGLGAGMWQARAANERTNEELGVRYLQMMDPYQMPHR
jgi:hypothetical protein